MPNPIRAPHPKCPNCGFVVYNRRYPKCESCGSALPTSIVYTAAELATMHEKERIEEAERARRKAQSAGPLGNASDTNFGWLPDPSDFSAE